MGRCRSHIALAAGLALLAGCRSYQTHQAPPTVQYGQQPPSVVVPAPDVYEGPPLRAQVAPVLPSATPQPAGPAVTDPYVAELLGILRETKTTDAFLTTVDLLVDVGADHRQVVPAIIRNAERLGIYGGSDQQLRTRVDDAIKSLARPASPVPLPGRA